MGLLDYTTLLGCLSVLFLVFRFTMLREWERTCRGTIGKLIVTGKCTAKINVWTIS